MSRRLTAGTALAALALTGQALATPAAQADAPTEDRIEVGLGLGDRVNRAGAGSVPITVHGSPTTDVADIALDSVVVGGRAVPVRSDDGTVLHHRRDVDGDGHQDVVLHVATQDLLAGTDPAAATVARTVTAELTDGGIVVGAVQTRPAVTLEVKFAEGYRVRGADVDLRSDAGRSLDGVEALLDRYGAESLMPFVAAADVDRLRGAAAGTRARAATPVPDLASWYTLTLPGDVDVDGALRELRALPDVATAYPAPDAVPPPQQPAPETTPDLTALQGHLRPAAENGIDSDVALGDPRARGAGITVVDLEYAWNPFHEDLQLDWSSDIGDGRFVPFDLYGDDHGTAVFGELAAVDNEFGVVGGVPDAEVLGISPIERLPNGNEVYNPGAALAFLATRTDDDGDPFLTAGDVVLIEQQTSSPLGGDRYAPLDWIPSVFEAHQVLTAMGVNVVLTGGNGNTDTDDPMYTRDGVRWFDRDVQDSGAIYVGAGGSGRSADPARARLGFSNHGSRFDLQAWGQDIVTAGYGGLFDGGGDHNRTYTDSFSGTSGAGPIVTNAVVAVQSYLRSTGQPPMTSAEVVELLAATGQPQTTNTAERIGPLPDLAAALQAIEVDAPVTRADLNQRPSRLGYVNPRVTLTADDGWGSGVAGTEYRVDGGSWVDYDGPFRVLGAGERTVEFRSVDENGTTEDPESLVIVNRGRGGQG